MITHTICGEVLYEGGSAVSYCGEPWGTEHSHSDGIPASAISLSEGTYTATVLVLGDEIAQINIIEQEQI